MIKGLIWLAFNCYSNSLSLLVSAVFSFECEPLGTSILVI